MSERSDPSRLGIRGKYLGGFGHFRSRSRSKSPAVDTTAPTAGQDKSDSPEQDRKDAPAQSKPSAALNDTCKQSVGAAPTTSVGDKPGQSSRDTIPAVPTAKVDPKDTAQKIDDQAPKSTGDAVAGSSTSGPSQDTPAVHTIIATSAGDPPRDKPKDVILTDGIATRTDSNGTGLSADNGNSKSADDALVGSSVSQTSHATPADNTAPTTSSEPKSAENPKVVISADDGGPNSIGEQMWKKVFDQLEAKELEVYAASVGELSPDGDVQTILKDIHKEAENQKGCASNVRHSICSVSQ
jgi:hypothetical protein